jgi:hypothetical protein
MIKRFTPLLVILFFTSLPYSQFVDLKAKTGQPSITSERDSSHVSLNSDRLYNPFDYGSRIMINICVHHFNYNEKFLNEDIVNSFVQQQGVLPDSIIGNPKSSESGMLFGFWFKYMKRFAKTGIFIRPQFELALGFGNTYEGTTQGKPVYNENKQIIGIRFEPFTTDKDNVFITTEFNLGYSNTNSHLPFALYSGLRFGLWIRDVQSNDNMINYKCYDWWSIPVGLIINKPVSNCWSLGGELTFDLMFSGGMRAVRSVDTIEIDLPDVTFGNRCGYRLELCADGMLTEHLSLHFSPYFNFYGFGKSTTGYSPDNNVSDTDNKVPFYEPESETFIAGMNITFTFSKSRH